MSFQTIQEPGFDNYIQGSEDDIDYNYNLKNISQIYLEENNYSLGDEKKVCDLTPDQFLETIQNKSKEDSFLIEKFESKNVEINFRSLMSNCYEGKNGKRIFVFFLPNEKNSKNIGKNLIKIFCYLMLSLNCKEGLIITKNDLTPACKDKLNCSNINPKTDPDIYNITYYIDSNFLPISKHSRVPKVLKIYRYPDEVKEFQKENNYINYLQFPRLLLSDPLVKFYRGSQNDVFKLERKVINEKNILTRQIVYRVVTKSSLNKFKK